MTNIERKIIAAHTLGTHPNTPEHEQKAALRLRDTLLDKVGKSLDEVLGTSEKETHTVWYVFTADFMNALAVRLPKLKTFERKIFPECLKAVKKLAMFCGKNGLVIFTGNGFRFSTREGYEVFGEAYDSMLLHLREFARRLPNMVKDTDSYLHGYAEGVALKMEKDAAEERMGEEQYNPLQIEEKKDGLIVPNQNLQRVKSLIDDLISAGEVSPVQPGELDQKAINQLAFLHGIKDGMSYNVRKLNG